MIRIVAFILVFGLGLVLGLWGNSPAPTPRPVVATSDSEVSDLIARLAPLSKKPDGEWYEAGLTVTFTGKRSVRIELKTPDGDEYHGRATTLKDAAKRITEPSTRIREALEGWAQ